MKKMNKKKVALGVGLGVAAAAGAVAAGYYFYGSKHATGNRKRTAAWASDLKANVLRDAKKLKKLDERAYRTVVDQAIKAYRNVRTIDQKDLVVVAAELKGNWKAVQREVRRVAKSEEKVARREVKKVAKTIRRVIPRMPTKKKKQ